MTYPEALQYLNSFINYEKKSDYEYKKSFKLEKMCALTEALGLPQEGIKSIHIAGTKGKGSTAAITQSILKNAGLKVGLYTSPHLVSFRERIRINDSLISEDETCRILERIRQAVEGMKDGDFSFFEIYTALAFLYFKEKKLDFAIYETGLGGRLDATNVVRPLVSVITPISYEHTMLLGNTLKDIAAEKAGIIKPNSICISGPQEREALDVIEDACERLGNRLVLVGRDILFEELSSNDEKEIFNVFGLATEYPMLESSLLGTHQVVNTAAAIGIIDSLRFHGIAISQDAVRRGVKEARWDGRLEIVSKRPYVILDGAQNRASANALARAIKKIFKYKKLILVLGVSKDKDIEGILKEMLSLKPEVVLTKSKVAERALEPRTIRKLIPRRNPILTSTVEAALNEARARADAHDLILVTGSLFVVGEAKEIYERN